MKSPPAIVSSLLLAAALTSTLHAQEPVDVDHMSGRREFWLAFPKNFRDSVTDERTQRRRAADELALTLTIVAETKTRVTIAIEGLGVKTNVSIEAGQTLTIPVDVRAQITSSGIVERRGVHVTADNPISLYACDRRLQTTDTWLVWPVEALGLSYRVVGWRRLQDDLLSQMTIVAAEDSTAITITPTAAVEVMSACDVVGGAGKSDTTARAPSLASAQLDTAWVHSPSTAQHSARSRRRKATRRAATMTLPTVAPSLPTDITQHQGNTNNGHGERVGGIPQTLVPTGIRAIYPPRAPVQFTLNRGEVLQLRAHYDPRTWSDLTGTLVVANRPIALFSGHNCAFVPDNSIKACNILVEQIPPVDTWGREYAVGTLERRTSSVVRVIAGEDDTPIRVNGMPVALLQAGEYWDDVSVTTPLWISSDKPIMVVQFSKGFDSGDNIGDPSMIVLPPVESFQKQMVIATPIEGSWNHYAAIIASMDDVSSIRVDGLPLDPHLFLPLEGAGYAVASIPLLQGRHVISCGGPFGSYQYGFGYDGAAYDAYGNAATYLMPRDARRLAPPNEGASMNGVDELSSGDDHRGERVDKTDEGKETTPSNGTTKRIER